VIVTVDCWCGSSHGSNDLSAVLLKKKKSSHRQSAWELIPFVALSWRGLNPIKLVYDPHQPDGRLTLTASAFNQLGQCTSSPGRKAYCYRNLLYSSLAVAETITCTHYVYQCRNAQAELAWVAGYIVR